MKTTCLIFLLLISFTKLTQAQTVPLSGTVKDNNNNPIPWVFIEDITYKNAAFADSAGTFKIFVHPDSRLLLKSVGHLDKIVDIDKSSSSVNIVLGTDGAGGAAAANLSASQSVLSTRPVTGGLTTNDLSALSAGESFQAAAHQKGQLHGNRYMFDNFVHGYVITPANEIFYSPAFRFDYDKIGGRFLTTTDNISVNELTADQIKSIVLFDNNAQRYELEKIPAIDNKHYVQVLSSGKKYKIYKTIDTKFVKSDYVNNGITAHGNDYDEYIDDYKYYLFDVQSNQLTPLSLKKKSIKGAFAKEGDKINKYLSDDAANIDDSYLVRLGIYMNN